MGYMNNIFIFYHDFQLKIFDVDQRKFHQKDYRCKMKFYGGRLRICGLKTNFIFGDKFYLQLYAPKRSKTFDFAVFDPKLFLRDSASGQQPYVLDKIVCDTKQFINNPVFHSNE